MSVTTRPTFAMFVVALCAACSGTTNQADAGLSDGGDAGLNGGQSACLPPDAGIPSAMPFLGASDSGVPLDQFAAELAWAECDFVSRCAPFAPFLVPSCIQDFLNGTPFGLYSECTPGALCYTELVTSTGGFPALTAVASVHAGFETYNPSVAGSCLAQPAVCPLATLNVLSPAFGPLSCADEPFRANQPDGGACDRPQDCIGWPNADCFADGGRGICQPTPAHDRFCGAADCRAGEFCDPALRTCRAIDAGSGFPCHGVLDCQPGFYCDLRNTDTCLQQSAPGGTCDYNIINSYGLGPCRGSSVCVYGTCALLSGLGGPCPLTGTSLDLSNSSGCESGLACSCGICVPPPVSGPCASAGTPCRQDVSKCVITAAGGFCQPL